MSKKMVFEKSWKEFREAGLLLLVNQFLHIFGWAIVFEYPDGTKKYNEPTRVYVARVKFRGFDDSSVTKAYKNVSAFMVRNAKKLLKEALS